MGLFILVVVVLAAWGAFAYLLDEFSDETSPWKRWGLPILGTVGAAVGTIVLLTLSLMIFGGAVVADKDEDR